jgi:hypothetical protein
MYTKTAFMSVWSVLGAAIVACTLGGLPSSAKALGFVPLGEGALPSGNLVQNFQFTIDPGESVPWHYHPGNIYGVIVSGTLTEDEGCGQPVKAISAGSAFFEETGKVHQVFNYGTGPVVIIFTCNFRRWAPLRGQERKVASRIPSPLAREAGRQRAAIAPPQVCAVPERLSCDS